MKVIQSWFNRVGILIGVVLLLIFVMHLNSRMVHMVQLRGEMETVLAKVNGLRAIEAELDEQISYAESADIVEKWARQENWMQKDGDYLIVLIPSGDPAPEPASEFALPQQKLSNWDAWKLWLTFQE